MSAAGSTSQTRGPLDDAARLEALVTRAHGLNLWIRFYTLNGHQPGRGDGWSEGYNFGAEASVRERWEAAVRARVDFVATDQYEKLATLLKQRAAR